MTNAELLDLLRRARKVADAVVADASNIAFAQWSPEQHEAEAVRDRIAAAIAQYAADMVQHRKDFVRDVKDPDRHLEAARSWKGGK